MSASLVWGVVIGMTVVNICFRLVPIAAMSRLSLPKPLERWLSYVPACVMASIVVMEVLRPGGRWLAPLQNPYLLAAIPTAVVYRTTRSFLGATLAGVAAFLAFRYLLG